MSEIGQSRQDIVAEQGSPALRPWYRRGSLWLRFAIVMVAWLALGMVGVLWCGLSGHETGILIVGLTLAWIVPEVRSFNPDIALTSRARRILIGWGVILAVVMIAATLVIPIWLSPGTTASRAFTATVQWSSLTAIVALYFYIKQRVERSLRAAEFLWCPSCEYQLTGLPDQGICPECGEEYSADYAQRYWQGQVKAEHPEDRFRR